MEKSIFEKNLLVYLKKKEIRIGNVINYLIFIRDHWPVIKIMQALLFSRTKIPIRIYYYT